LRVTSRGLGDVYKRQHHYSDPFLNKSDLNNLENINNIQIIFINSNKVLLVKDKESNKWMIPSGKRYHNESFKDALHRIFKSITNFDIKSDNINYSPRINRNMELSIVYKIESEQDDELTDKNELIYIPMDDLNNLINNDIPYYEVESLLLSTKSVLNDTFFR
jgi:ADP-ribose pyrophosphatase YjhB (NUDIX family)